MQFSPYYSLSDNISKLLDDNYPQLLSIKRNLQNAVSSILNDNQDIEVHEIFTGVEYAIEALMAQNPEDIDETVKVFNNGRGGCRKIKQYLEDFVYQK